MALTHDERAAMLKRASIAAVATAGFLIVIKTGASWLTGSTAVLGTLLDSGIDAIASLVNMVAIRYALEPADEDHRFGHGRAEQLAGLGQSLFIMASGLALGVRAVVRILEPAPVEDAAVGMVAMVIALLVTAALVTYQRRVARLTHSPAIAADSLHYASDVLLHGSVLAGLVAWEMLGWLWLDGALGVAIAAWLIYGAVRIWLMSVHALMDRELPDEERELIRRCVDGHPEVSGMHELRTRLSGATRIIQFHLEMDPELPLRRAHQISVEVAAEIRERIPNSEVLIHEDPTGLHEH